MTEQHSSHSTPHSAAVAVPGAGAGDPVPDPGMPPHEPRLTDVDPVAEKRAERQISTLFGLSALLTLAVVVAYIAIPVDATILNTSASNLALGGGLGLALLLIGIGAVQWSKRLISDDEVIEERHGAASPEEDRQEAVDIVSLSNQESGFGRRRLIRGSLIGALAVLGLPAIVFLGDLGPLATVRQMHTVWRRGMRVVNDPDMRPIRAEDVQIGQLVNGLPAELESMEGHEVLTAKATSAVILVRMAPDEINAAADRREWGVDGILCYSKICTHVGCPTNLYERHTKHLLCPCHQSTFDLSNNGKVVFGPAGRPMPQLPIMVDDEGYLVAQSDFTEPIGPSYWERERDADNRWNREERGDDAHE